MGILLPNTAAGRKEIWVCFPDGEQLDAELEKDKGSLKWKGWPPIWVETKRAY